MNLCGEIYGPTGSGLCALASGHDGPCGSGRRGATFAGIRGAVLCEASTHGHVLRVVTYSFADGSSAPYVEVSEAHEGRDAGNVRVHALSEVVHLLINIGEDDFWKTATRDAPATTEGPRS